MVKTRDDLIGHQNINSLTTSALIAIVQAISATLKRHVSLGWLVHGLDSRYWFR